MRYEVTSKKHKTRRRRNQYEITQAKVIVSGAKNEKEALEVANSYSKEKGYWIKAIELKQEVLKNG